ncbi:hypothetical protein HHK36_017540 [Tetracentron sinense]|uniref:CCT-theta n=1 Tax=Tetracentron sinense TaxID=13715 RepID=A0A834Z069_TETSI|nr:hypothetical protein HHK36_017540 [Tetracentron sinense]
MVFQMKPYGVQSMLKEGHKHLSGLDQAVLKNIDACNHLSTITRTSLGPNGMNKMVINHLDKLFVTNDAATIVNELKVQHPAAKILVLAGKAQQEEIGDGANLTISFAGELLQNAEDLIRMGLHPSEIISGYTKAINKTAEILDELVEKGSDTMDVRNKDQVVTRMKAVVASKQFGQEEILCPRIADACIQVCPKNPANFNVDNVRVAKLLGGGLRDCTIVRGMVLKNDAIGSIKRMEKAKIAVFAGGVDTSATETKGTVLIHSAEQLVLKFKALEMFVGNAEKAYESPPSYMFWHLWRDVREVLLDDHGPYLDQSNPLEGAPFCNLLGPVEGMAGGLSLVAATLLENYAKTEEAKVEELIKAVADSGAKVIVSGAAVGEMALHFCERYKLMVLKISSKFELRRFCRTTGAVALLKLSQPNPDDLGYADFVSVEEIGGVRVTIVKNEEGGNSVCTVVLRGSTDSILDDLERAVDDGVNTYKEFVQSTRCDAYVTLELDQYAIAKFAESFEMVPKTLAENAGLNAMVIISSLYAEHTAGNTKVGINLEEGVCKDVSTMNMWDLHVTNLLPRKLLVVSFDILIYSIFTVKKNIHVFSSIDFDVLFKCLWFFALKYAADAACTVLRVDQIIMAKQAGGPKRDPAAGMDED